MSTYEILTWNINHRSGYGFNGKHDFSFEMAKRENKDIYVFTEVCKKGNIYEKLDELFPEYKYVFTDNEQGQNDVLICVRNNIEIKEIQKLYSSKVNDNPNYLQLLLSDGEQEWYQIGIRLRVCQNEIDFGMKQMQIVNEVLNDLDSNIPICISGDWNMDQRNVEEYMMDGYRVAEMQENQNVLDNYSFVFSKEGKIIGKGVLDHVVISGMVEVLNIKVVLCQDLAQVKMRYSSN